MPGSSRFGPSVGHTRVRPPRTRKRRTAKFPPARHVPWHPRRALAIRPCTRQQEPFRFGDHLPSGTASRAGREMMFFGNASRETKNLNLNSNMTKMLEKLVKRLLPIALAGAGLLHAETKMTVSGIIQPTIADYLPQHPGLEKVWSYDIVNTSTVGDINNMIEWHINAGTNNNILDVSAVYNGLTGTIIPYLSFTEAGFTGLLPPKPTQGINNYVQINIITSADTTSIPGLATARSEGSYYGGDNFNSIAVNVPFLPANILVESATQQVEGLTEIRYRITNKGTPKATANIPVGTNNGLTNIYVSAGIEVTMDQINSFLSTATGGLNLNQSALYVIRTPNPLGEASNIETNTGNLQYFGAFMPGPNVPRSFSTSIDTQLKGKFFIQPGALITPQYSSNLYKWDDEPQFRMPYTANVLEYSVPAIGPAGYIRVNMDVPAVNNHPELLQLPAVIEDPRVIDGVTVSPGVSIVPGGPLEPVRVP